MIEAPSPRRYRQPYWSRYASPYGQDRGLRARPYRYRGTYGGWSIARPYYYGSRAMPFYRYRWTERRPYVGTPRFAARILTPQASPGLLYEARRY